MKRKALLFYQMRLKKLESKEAGTSLMKKYKKNIHLDSLLCDVLLIHFLFLGQGDNTVPV